MEAINPNEEVKDSRKLYIAVGDSRRAKKWKHQEITYAELLNRLSETTRTRETVLEFKRMAKAKRDDIKDVGGFVGGTLKGGKRRAENLANRSFITLDMDNISTTVDEAWGCISKALKCEVFIYSTHSHEAGSPRLRLGIPLDRSVLPDEYQAISRKIAEDIGIDMFDDTTYEPSRLMYWPSTPIDGEYIFKRQVGEWLIPDAVLSRYVNWKDATLWPVSSRQEVRVNSLIKKQEDPLEKSGVIGAFCRTYTITDVIDNFLKDVYAPTEHEGRYSFIGGSTSSGLVVYDDKFVYSHHGTDPASGLLCNAFDLVRLHKFGSMDADLQSDTPPSKLPSFMAMREFAVKLDAVKITLGTDRAREVDSEFFTEPEVEDNLDWMSKLEREPKSGNVKCTIDNVVTILQNDTSLAGKLRRNEFAERDIISGRMPWDKDNIAEADREWKDADDAQLRWYLETKYGIVSTSKINDATVKVFNHNGVHPVKEYLYKMKKLGWDETKRVELLMLDYFGAEDTPYNRAVIKIHLVAAIARVMQPGIKYDTVLTLIGEQGIGKSTFIKLLSKGWFSDSLDSIKGKEAYEQLQGQWHIEMAELTATRKADIEAVKHFLSKSEDIFRVAYGRRTAKFKRQCVFWGTSNDKEFLRDRTGDRRTWPVACGVVLPSKDIFTDLAGEVDQIWAEAMFYYEQDTKLYLEGEVAAEAVRQQQIHTEDNPKKGLIVNYLEGDFPTNWDELTLFDRRRWVDGDKDDDVVFSQNRTKKNKTCVMEVWCEVLKGEPKLLNPVTSREIGDILRSLDNWESLGRLSKFGKLYGAQRTYSRKN